MVSGLPVLVLQSCQAKRLEHVFPAAQARILYLDGGHYGFPFGGAKLFPRCAKFGLPGLVTFDLSFSSRLFPGLMAGAPGLFQGAAGFLGLGLIVARYLIIGADRRDQVARGILANSLILVANQPVEDVDLGANPGGGMGADQFLGGPGRDSPGLEALDQLNKLLRFLGSWIRGGARAPDQDDSPGASLDKGVSFFRTERLEETEVLKFFKGRFEPALELGRRVRAAQADVSCATASGWISSIRWH